MDNIGDMIGLIEQLGDVLPSASLAMEADDLLVLIYGLHTALKHTNETNATEAMIRALDVWYDRIWGALVTIIDVAKSNEAIRRERN